MKHVRHDKLVRDRIPEIIAASGRWPVTRQIGTQEYRRRLEAKVREELDELCAPDADRAAELADLLEVLYALAQLEGLSPERLEALRARKREERGGFDGRILLSEVLEE